MERSKRLKAELGLDNSEFKEKLKESQSSIDSFGGATLKQAASLTSFIALATTAAKVMVDWWRDTASGVTTVTAGLTAAKQLLTDIMLRQNSHLKEAWELGKQQAQQQWENAKEAYIETKYRSEINQLVVKAADQTASLAERQQALNEAISKERELKSFLLQDAKEELAIAEKQWKLQPQSKKAMEEFYKALSRYHEVQGMDSRRLMSQQTSLIIEQRKRAQELFELYSYGTSNTLKGLNEQLSNLNAELADINLNDTEAIRLQKEKIEALQKYINLVKEGKVYTPGTFTLPGIAPVTAPKGIETGVEAGVMTGAPKAVEVVNEMTYALQMQEQAVTVLEDAFYNLFASTGNGFRDMIDTIMSGIRQMIAELIAKAAVLTLLRVLFPGTAIGAKATTGLMNIFGQGAFASTGVNASATGVIGFGSGNFELSSVVRGKDLGLILRRNG